MMGFDGSDESASKEWLTRNLMNIISKHLLELNLKLPMIQNSSAIR